VVNVTVDQSTNLVVDPASLEIPANGAATFTVKLANAPTEPVVTVTVTPSTPNLTTNPPFLPFTPGNFNFNQTVLVSAGLGAVPGAKSVVLDAGKLGKFNLPVTITPTSNTIFFIDPKNGSDTFPGTGTAAKPWQTVEQALDITKPSGSQVAAVASAGNDVVVTILGGANTENVGASITTQALSAGSVTVLQAPFPKTFTLNMGGNKLILKDGYKLQDINITFNLGGAGTAVKITHPTAGLASVDVTCNATGGGFAVTCVEVVGAGSHILKDVRVDVTDLNASNIGILNNDASANLSIVGGRVRPTSNNTPITSLIDSKGVLTVTGLEVDMTNAGHTQNSTGIILQASPSLVTGSTIKVSNKVGSVGIKVQGTANPSTVVGNTFKGSGNGIGVQGGSNLSPDVLSNNTFSGAFTTQVQP
jgi:hypothetical protein